MATRQTRGAGNGGGEQVEILRAIWNEMKGLNAGVDKTNERLEKTNGRLDKANGRLDKTNEALDSMRSEMSGLRAELKTDVDTLHKRAVESELRLATATTEFSTDVRRLSGLFHGWREEHREDRADGLDR
ncbi:MAG: hypothetical protein HY897_05085 [Deltaproteobacteria bacterium]|nr:hypothetical protein [Deltaproteobacteria bacterium]